MQCRHAKLYTLRFNVTNVNILTILYPMIAIMFLYSLFVTILYTITITILYSLTITLLYGTIYSYWKCHLTHFEIAGCVWNFLTMFSNLLPLSKDKKSKILYFWAEGSLKKQGWSAWCLHKIRFLHELEGRAVIDMIQRIFLSSDKKTKMIEFSSANSP